MLKRFTRSTLFPLFLIIACAPATIIIWYVNVVLGGSLHALWDLCITNGFLTTLYHIWWPVIFGTKVAWIIIGAFIALQLILMCIVPGKNVQGAYTPKGNVPVYKANGISCYLITLILFYFSAYQFHIFSPTIIFDNFGAIIGALNIFSLLFCLILYIKGRVAPSSADHSSNGNFIFDYYWGTELHPRILGWDVKMFTTCRVGMMSWALIIFSFGAKQAQLYGLSSSMLVAIIIQLAYITKFFLWETGYLRSLDIMHDRAGFYICWGCLVWVPAIYTSPTLYLVNHSNHLSWPTAIIITTLGISCVIINYLADAQRQRIRATNGSCKVWGKKPEIIVAQYTTAQGETKQNLLLASGWWGLSRHFHYLPEILAALFWSIPALFEHVLPYFYVVFLTILLFHRSMRDEQRCHTKYGDDWEAYCKRVPNRIIPSVIVMKLAGLLKWWKSSTSA